MDQIDNNELSKENSDENENSEKFEENDEKLKELDKNDDETNSNSQEQVFQSVLNNTENLENENCENKYKLCNDLVLLVDDDNHQTESKSLNKLNSLSNGDFIEEDYMPNQLNISKSNSNSDDEYSNLKESNLNHLENLKNNLNQFDQNIKIIEQKDKIFLPITSNSTTKIKSNSMDNINSSPNNFRSILNSEFNNIAYTEATVLNRNDLSYSSSLSSSYSNINSNPVKSSTNSLTNHLELKFDSLSSIEDNSKFNLNTNALTDSTILVTNENKFDCLKHDDTFSNKHEANIWTETEAVINQFDQIGPSACGATAILNVLKALNFEFDIETVCSKVKVNLRIPEEIASSTTLADYLFSRSVAGMNERELIENIEKASDNKIAGRFFPFYPQREIILSEWLATWIRKGAVPVALLNLQKSPVWGFVPDAWHHQMIYACDSNFIYLTNPLESKSIETIMNELTSESVLLVRSYDVVKRFNANKYNLLDLIIMKNYSDDEKKRWYDMNVMGQVLNVLREHKLMYDNILNNLANQMDTQETSQASLNEINNSGAFDFIDAQSENNRITHHISTNSNQNGSNNLPYITHISIPASYRAGITLFAYRDSILFKEILDEYEIPIKK